MILNARAIPSNEFLGITIAVELPNGLYRHYQVPHAFTLAVTNDEQEAHDLAVDMVRDRVKQDFGQDTELGLLNKVKRVDEYKTDSRPLVPLYTGWFSPAVIDAMKQRKAKTLLYQYNKNHSRFSDRTAMILDRLYDKFLAPPVSFLNRGIGKLNRLLQKLYGVDKMWDSVVAEMINDFKVTHDEIEHTSEYYDLLKKYEAATKGKFFMPFIPQHRGSFTREVTIPIYLVRRTGEENLDRTIEMLSADLAAMERWGLIFGNLSMPMMTELTHDIGNGKRTYIVYAFPLLNTHRLLEILKLQSVFELPRNYMTDTMRSLGIGSAVFEGGAEGEIPYKDQIESVVTVGKEVMEARRRADNDEVVKAYKEQIATIEKLAKSGMKRT